MDQQSAGKGDVKGVFQRSRSGEIIDRLRALVDGFEKNKPTGISIMAISRQHNLSHRRVYDFFSLLSSLGVCHSVGRGRMAWVSLEAIERTLMEAYALMEVRSLKQPLDELFKTGRSPSLGILGLNFLLLFFYLGVDVLPMRRVTLALHDKRAAFKSVERRTYLAVSFLVAVGVVERTDRTGEYKIVIKKESIIEKAMRTKKEFCSEEDQTTLETLLNKFSDTYFTCLYKTRSDTFCALE